MYAIECRDVYSHRKYVARMDSLAVEIYIHDLTGRLTADVRFLTLSDKRTLIEQIESSTNFPNLDDVAELVVTNKLRFMDAANILNARIKSDGTLDSDVMLMNERDFLSLRRAFSKIEDKRICIYAVGCLELKDGTSYEFLAYKTMSDGLSYLSLEKSLNTERKKNLIKRYEDDSLKNDLSIIERSLCYLTTEC